MVVIWGLGFGGRRDDLLDDGLRFVNFLKNDPVYGGNTVMIGVPSQWRTTDTEKAPWAKMEKLLAATDIIQPWMVGGPATPEQVVTKYADVVKNEG